MVKAPDNVQERSLAAAGVAEDGDKFILPKLQVHALERMDDGIAGFIVFSDLAEFEHGYPFYTKRQLTTGSFCCIISQLKNKPT